MLARLSIRDIVLIDRLDIDFGSGLAVLTGETGAGKSILLDAFALALGARGDVALVRDGAEQGQVIAAFEIGQGHPARALLADNGLSGEDELILRRVQFADGRTRAFVNDQPVSVQVLRALGAALVEIHGQHDERAFVEAATHRGLLDAYGGIEGEAAAVAELWAQWRAREAAVQSHRADVERANREAEWLRHAVEELSRLAPQPGEESALAERRATMMQAEKVADDLRSTYDNLAGPNSAVSPLASAVRRLERRAAQAPTLVEPVTKAIDAALTALDEARLQLEHALQLADYDPQELEKIEERLFALRAAGRKYNAPVDELANLARRYESNLGLIDAGAERLAALERDAREDSARYRAAAEKLSAARRGAALALDKAVNAELK
ncbi:MAG: AAA family ATPase, partial [Rhizobiales bacterium]|nr:AAA family ATPase [Hyphomicrobiales bacterium]